MVPTENITNERLRRWAKKLAIEHATPTVLVGIGHDHKSGRLVVCTVEDISNDELRAMLVYALKELE